MPQKTAGERLQVVRVPLNTRALPLVEKYKEREDLNGKLFPFARYRDIDEDMKEELVGLLE